MKKRRKHCTYVPSAVLQDVTYLSDLQITMVRIVGVVNIVNNIVELINRCLNSVTDLFCFAAFEPFSGIRASAYLSADGSVLVIGMITQTQ